jgi:hypothetical protein
VLTGKKKRWQTLSRTALGMMCDRYGLHSCGFLGSKGASVNGHLRPSRLSNYAICMTLWGSASKWTWMTYQGFENVLFTYLIGAVLCSLLEQLVGIFRHEWVNTYMLSQGALRVRWKSGGRMRNRLPLDQFFGIEFSVSLPAVRHWSQREF